MKCRAKWVYTLAWPSVSDMHVVGATIRKAQAMPNAEQCQFHAHHAEGEILVEMRLPSGVENVALDELISACVVDYARPFQTSSAFAWMALRSSFAVSGFVMNLASWSTANSTISGGVASQ